MITATRHVRHILVNTAAVIGIGLASLPATALAKHCMMMKPYGHAGPMQYHGPVPYYPPMHHHHVYSYGCDKRARGVYGRCEQGPGHAQASEPASAAGGAEASATGADILDTAAAAQTFQTLIRAAEAAGLEATLRGAGPLTVFAPSDAAFAKLPEGTLEELLADKERLVALLSYHLVPGRLTAADLLTQRDFKTVQGETLSIEQLEVATADIDASNGIIHAIDSVLVPSR
ncbi:MAG: fasciclin domain-containing protein [Gammaproteobacteria bacterium]|jgi:uncharacterized surface protein with fasciclin (FAS1) repeats